MAKIAVIIVNYGAAELAIEAVDSVLKRAPDDHEVHVHLVDNASPSGDGAVLQERMNAWGEGVTLYRETVNHGFGRGNNLVLRQLGDSGSAPDYVFLLNPDARLRNATLSILVDFMQKHQATAILGARAYNPGGDCPVTAAFRFPGMASTFAAAVNFGPVSRLFGRWRVARDPAEGTMRVDWVSGAAVLARYEVWRDLGFFDPAYFLYYEEVDLMLRTSRAGWECWHVAEAEIEHVEGASTQVKGAHHGPQRRPAYWYESWRHYFVKNYGRPYAIGACFAWLSGAGLNWLIAKLRGQTPAAPLRFFRDFPALVLWPILTGRGLLPAPDQASAARKSE